MSANLRRISAVFWIGMGVLGTGCGGTTPVNLTTSDIQSIALLATDEGLDASIEDSAGAGLTARMGGRVGGGFTVARSCSASGFTATVEETWSGSVDRSLTRRRLSLTTSATASGTETRAWTVPNTGYIGCTGAGRADLNWQAENSINGMKLAIDTNRTKARSRTITTPKTTLTRDFSSTVKGTRTVTWGASTTADAKITRTKTIASSVTRTYSSTKDGTTETGEYTVATAGGADLQVEVTRSTADDSLLAKKVVAGTLIFTRADQSHVDLSFANLTFDLTAADPCQPTGGTLTGSIYPAEAEAEDDPEQVFTIHFGVDTDSGATLTEEADGTATDAPELSFEGCDLDVI